MRHGDMPQYHLSSDDVDQEHCRVARAIEIAAEGLDQVIHEVTRRIGKAEAQIFQAHKAILLDQTLLQEIKSRIESSRVNAETATIQTLDAYQARLLQVDNEYMRERVSDIREVQKRLLGELVNREPQFHCSDQAHCRRGRGRIVVAEELTPGLSVGANANEIKGFVSERGGAASHAAILARSLCVPAVSGIASVYDILDCGTELLINGDTGEIIAWPADQTIAQFNLNRQDRCDQSRFVPSVNDLKVMANINRFSESTLAFEYLADGIGLFRTEMEFFAEGRLLSEQEQYERYASVVQSANGKSVTFRLLDIGGDKTAPFFLLPKHDNHPGGLRGSRLLLERDDLLRPQVRALARASTHGPLDILYPMVIDRDQFLKLRSAFEELTADLATGHLRHGVMFEVPSACMQAKQLFEVAEFGSIGTNDLVQFLFAVDRTLAVEDKSISLDQPLLWSLLHDIADAARDAKRDISICGEAASDVRYLHRLMEVGIRSVSVTPRSIPQIRLAAQRQISTIHR
jgi:phosphotransferase system enzyme I (PtsI)